MADFIEPEAVPPPAAQIAWPRLARVDETAVEPALAPRTAGVGGSPPWVFWAAMQLGGFALLLGGYYLGRAWSQPGEADAVAVVADSPEKKQLPRGASERALDAADRALEAERRRDYAGARHIYEEMLKRQAPLPGAEYRLALLALHQGNYRNTELHLSRSIALRDDIADCDLLRASLAGMKENYADASIQLAAAARAQPFSAKLYFCWGEALRRAGKLSDGIARLKECLQRPDNDAARELYLFKLRLAQVEANDPTVAGAILAHLSQPLPEGNWLLLAAAQEISRRRFPAAADRLEQAKAILPLAKYNSYVRDYFFQAHVGRPELAALLNVPPPVPPTPNDGPLEDPAVWTPAEADPAVWPPFTPAE